jgi:hypothetical protein
MTANTIAKVVMGQFGMFAVALNVAVELVHHDNDGGNPLGPKQLKGQADYTHHQHRLPHAREEDRRRIVEFGKRYEPYPPPPLIYRMRDDGRLEAVPTEAKSQHPVTRCDLAPLQEPISPPPKFSPAPNTLDAAQPSGLTPEQQAILTALSTLPRLPGAPGVPFMMLQRATGMKKSTLYDRLVALHKSGHIARTVHQGNTYWHTAQPPTTE